MTRTARVAAGIGGVLVAGALAVTVAAATGEATAPPARAVAATLDPTSSGQNGQAGSTGQTDSAGQTGRAVGAGGATGHTPGSTGQGWPIASWAAALGVDEATLRSALAAARADARAQRSASDGAAQGKATFFAALATRLGRPETQVRSTFRAFLATHQAGSRDALAERLDAAVAAGRISEAERTSILKAYDAGLLGRGGGRTSQAGSTRPAGQV